MTQTASGCRRGRGEESTDAGIRGGEKEMGAASSPAGE